MRPEGRVVVVFSLAGEDVGSGGDEVAPAPATGLDHQARSAVVS